jgi:hypothetical protein
VIDYKSGSHNQGREEMPPNDGFSKDLIDLVKFAVALFVVALVFSWLLILLALAGITSWPHVDTNAVLFLFALSIALSCFALWISHHLGVIKLTKETEGRIWKALILATLVAVAGCRCPKYEGTLKGYQ